MAERLWEAEIHEAIALLDRKNPGWRDSIVLDELRMGDGEHCVLGQVYGDYDVGMTKLFTKRKRDAEGFRALAESYGFEVEYDWYTAGGRSNYGVLTRAWKRVLKELGIGT
jgi:hypothetical protein